MKTGKDLIAEGLEALCQSDNDIENLVNPRFEEIISLLERYVKEIELFNAAYGLVSVKDTEELVIRHILDSIAPLGIIYRLLEKKTDLQQIADAGSGAGLPGIPLAITLADCNFTLIERMARRAGFLNNTKAILGIANFSVEESSIEVLLREENKKGYFSLVTFRAFKPLEPKLLKILLNSCKENGLIAAYKGRREKIEQEMAQLKANCQWEMLPYKTPFLDQERHILVIRAQ